MVCMLFPLLQNAESTSENRRAKWKANWKNGIQTPLSNIIRNRLSKKSNASCNAPGSGGRFRWAACKDITGGHQTIRFGLIFYHNIGLITLYINVCTHPTFSAGLIEKQLGVHLYMHVIEAKKAEERKLWVYLTAISPLLHLTACAPAINYYVVTFTYFSIRTSLMAHKIIFSVKSTIKWKNSLQYRDYACTSWYLCLSLWRSFYPDM